MSLTRRRVLQVLGVAAAGTHLTGLGSGAAPAAAAPAAVSVRSAIHGATLRSANGRMTRRYSPRPVSFRPFDRPSLQPTTIGPWTATVAAC